MVILHVASIENNPFSGVCVVVPQHIRAQSAFAEVALLNVNGRPVDGVETQLAYSKDFDLRRIPAPFDSPDLVVFHEAYRVEYLRVYKRLKKAGIPYVIIPHGELREEAQRKKKWKKKIANLLFFNAFINGAAAIQCLSEMERDNTAFGKEKFVASNGVGIPSKEKSSFSKFGLRITYIGRLEVRVKGLDLLLQAIKTAKKELKAAGARVELYGPDYQGRFAEVQSLIEENGVGDLVTLHREVSGEEKENILLDTDIFIQTSRHEGMPMGILEAMSYGIPCLVTEGTTLKPLIARYDGGFAAETKADSIARMLVRAIDERETLPEKSKNARQAVEENFSWAYVAEKAIEEYKRAL